MMRRWSANVMTSGRQGLTTTYDKSTSGRLAVEGTQGEITMMN
jgi:hypothetical protein